MSGNQKSATAAFRGDALTENGPAEGVEKRRGARPDRRRYGRQQIRNQVNRPRRWKSDEGSTEHPSHEVQHIPSEPDGLP